jgi:hypothetical protein
MEAGDPPLRWFELMNIRLSTHGVKLSVLLGIIEILAFFGMLLFVVIYIIYLMRRDKDDVDVNDPVQSIIPKVQLSDSCIQRPTGRRGTLIGGEGMSDAQEAHLYGGPLRHRRVDRETRSKMAALEKLHNGMMFNEEPE